VDFAEPQVSTNNTPIKIVQNELSTMNVRLPQEINNFVGETCNEKVAHSERYTENIMRYQH